MIAACESVEPSTPQTIDFSILPPWVAFRFAARPRLWHRAATRFRTASLPARRREFRPDGPAVEAARTGNQVLPP